MHPLVGNFDGMKDSEIESKITDLSKKYFMTKNFEVQNQISMVLDSYKSELSRRQQNALNKVMNDKGLDKLVKVN
jgi:hypothetical protein